MAEKVEVKKHHHLRRRSSAFRASPLSGSTPPYSRSKRFSTAIFLADVHATHSAHPLPPLWPLLETAMPCGIFSQ